MTRLLCFWLSLWLLSGCRYSLTDQAKIWNPYQAGDVLVFESNHHEHDTIYITEVKRYFEGKNEILIINCNLVEHHTSPTKRTDTVYSWLMALTAWESGKSVMSFNLPKRNVRFSPFNAKPLSWIDSLPKADLKINNHTYKDVITLEPDADSTSNWNHGNDSLRIRKVFWNKSNGLLKYESANGETIWKLKRKHRTTP